MKKEKKIKTIEGQDYIWYRWFNHIYKLPIEEVRYDKKGRILVVYAKETKELDKYRKSIFGTKHDYCHSIIIDLYPEEMLEKWSLTKSYLTLSYWHENYIYIVTSEDSDEPYSTECNLHYATLNINKALEFVSKHRNRLCQIHEVPLDRYVNIYVNGYSE